MSPRILINTNHANAGNLASLTRVLNAFRERAHSDRRKEVLARFLVDLVAKNLKNTWRSEAVRIYRNWLLYILNKERFEEEKLTNRSNRFLHPAKVDLLQPRAAGANADAALMAANLMPTENHSEYEVQ